MEGTHKDAPDIARLLQQKMAQLAFKRAFDIAFSTIGLLIIWPVLLIIALAIALDSRGGVLFRQTRVGKNGVEFKILKFRTMIPKAEAKGMQLTVGRDSRITRVGKLLRKTKLDELPQLINVFAGDMSFVGPRPEVPKYVKLYTKEQRQVLLVRPGITDLASIQFRHESELLSGSEHPEQTYIGEIMPEKIRLNMLYLKNLSVWNDVLIILRTIRRIIF